jgi:hypothetical protein
MLQVFLDFVFHWVSFLCVVILGSVTLILSISCNVKLGFRLYGFRCSSYTLISCIFFVGDGLFYTYR